MEPFNEGSLLSWFLHVSQSDGLEDNQDEHRVRAKGWWTQISHSKDLQPPIGLSKSYQYRVASEFMELHIFLQSILSRKEMEAGTKLEVVKDLQLRR